LHDRLLFCRTYILPEDLEHFLEPEKAQQAFDILDVDGDGQVTLHNIRDAVVTIYQVRKALFCFSCKLDIHILQCVQCSCCLVHHQTPPQCMQALRILTF